MDVLPRASRARLKYFGSTVDHLLPECESGPHYLRYAIVKGSLPKSLIPEVAMTHY